MAICNTFFLKDGNIKARWYYKCNDVCKIENSFLFLVHKKDIRGTQSCTTSFYGNKESSKTNPKLSLYNFLSMRSIDTKYKWYSRFAPNKLTSEGCVIPVMNVTVIP